MTVVWIFDSDAHLTPVNCLKETTAKIVERVEALETHSLFFGGYRGSRPKVRIGCISVLIASTVLSPLAVLK